MMRRVHSIGALGTRGRKLLCYSKRPDWVSSWAPHGPIGTDLWSAKIDLAYVIRKHSIDHARGKIKPHATVRPKMFHAAHACRLHDGRMSSTVNGTCSTREMQATA